MDYEKLGVFYLGRACELPGGELRPEPMLYDSRDLTTHAVLVGMTGSGKTGLGITLLEEAAIDGIPALIIDPKGDMGNLLLGFPQLTADEFAPWIDEREAARQGMTVEQSAARTAQAWKAGLAEWDQTPDRIARFRDAVDVAIYTPGSDAGLPLSVLRSLDAPPPSVRDDSESLRERVSTAVAGLLALLGVEGDPLRSREHILLANLLEHAWRDNRNLDIGGLIREIQSPPFAKIGIMDLETMYPAADRMQLALMLNNVLAAPGFEAWTRGEPLDIARLLHTPEGKPRLSILSIAHLSDRERMFFVTILLNEVVAWMRSQPGTSSLRALLYMDEVFGYLPPTAMPPSKLPLLTLLKQARAFGVGVVLATQNPVDLDYKALSNAGTWFLGRLQTERDKERVLDGLEGASAAAGEKFDRQRVQQTLSALRNRVFLMNNVHDDAPIVFQTRWALSFLRGPLTRDQIRSLMQPRKALAAASAAASPAAPAVVSSATAADSAASAGEPPVLSPDIPQRFAAVSRNIPAGVALTYVPHLLGIAKVHYVDAQSRSGVDVWRPAALLGGGPRASSANPWDGALALGSPKPELARRGEPDAAFAPLPSEMAQARSYRSWKTDLTDHLYRSCRLSLSFCPSLKQYARPDESEGDFRARLQHALREERDSQIDKLRKKYAIKVSRLEDAVRRAGQRVEAEKSQASSAVFSSLVSFGSTILSALFGRKKFSVSNASRAATSMRSAGRASQQRDDVKRAEQTAATVREELSAMERECAAEIERLSEELSLEQLKFEDYSLSPRKSDIDVAELALVWVPHFADREGTLASAANETFSAVQAPQSLT